MIHTYLHGYVESQASKRRRLYEADKKTKSIVMRHFFVMCAWTVPFVCWVCSPWYFEGQERQTMMMLVFISIGFLAFIFPFEWYKVFVELKTGKEYWETHPHWEYGKYRAKYARGR